MNKLFFTLLFSLTLNAYELKEDYTYINHTLYSTDLFPDLTKKFELLKIPEDKTQYRINAQVIAKTFELNGVEIDIAKVRYVNFIQQSPVDFTPIKNQLESLLRAQYPSIRIEEIIITPRGYLTSLPKKGRGVFDEHLFTNAKGTFYIVDETGIRRYLDYSVRATINILHTNQKVSRRDRISGFNTQIKQIPFTSFIDTPLATLPSESSRFRSNLRAGQLLTLRNIETVPLVLKNEKVVVEVKNDSVVVEFAATATQEGLLYDIITVQKNDGKRVKAKVIGENRVELQ
ncbi:flagellar basal body P-ring formation chaperone FlgA [Sulfuricurvum sp.]|uniref:flagellar basal body P-ring formation chaperone FlgA n=1 Tax=Sulfuricurvum sp. TaxID=2025608 RepID=UPI002E34FEAD|nr:flagellar basal body P-ring formation chaperone FlgA [Sulfuricurvum sp.]HEX5329337.1 flagellar basal body P-ring formation chaperone FlgA [Sulfuricurvum sp.]